MPRLKNMGPTIAGACCVLAFVACTEGAASEFTPEAFRSPGAEYSPAFFWMWNAKLEPATLDAQLEAMASNGLMNVCIHPFPKEFRPGKFASSLTPGYLTPEYIELYGRAVEKAKSLGMHSWLYDEGGWPSGGAAGLVAASDHEGKFRQQRIGFGRHGDEPLHRSVEEYGEGRANYPSMIEPGATERFLEITHERLKKRIGGEFGKTVKFAFMDEPGTGQPHWWPIMNWCSDMREEFQKRKGYDIWPHIEEVIKSRYDTTGRAVEMRVDYMEVLGDLFVERFMLPVRDWCRANGLLSGGHLDGEDDPSYGVRYGYGNLLKSLRAMDVPGVDVIWRQLWPASVSTAGRQVPFPRFAASAAHYNGGRYVLSESFGIYGDSMSPAEMMWVLNYQLVRGVNTFIFGYMALSTAGQWMTLFEPHFGPASPLWEFQRPLFEYLHRTGAMLGRGRSAAEIVVHYDQRSFWTGGAVAGTAAKLQEAVAACLDRQNTDFDFADDTVFAEATVAGGALRMGQASYSTVVVPAWGRMSAAARAKIEDFRKVGGRVLTGSEVAAAPRTCGVRGLFSEDIRVLKRVSGDRTLYFLVNEALHPTEDLEITFAEKGPVVCCDPATERFVAVDASDGRFTWRFGSCGSAIFVVGAPVEAQPAPGAGPTAKGLLNLSDGWTLRARTRHFAGKRDLEVAAVAADAVPARLGDWRPALGYDFSGTAVYRNEFKADAVDAVLDLGNVKWACSAKLNGVELPAKFLGPFRWPVTLLAGRNVLEVTVGNTLANALAPGTVRDRIARDFPPRSGYDIRQARYDQENNESGLYGPVRILMREKP